VQSRVKALEKIEKIELPKKRAVVKFEFRPPPRSGEQVAVLEGVTKTYGKRVVHDCLNLLIRRGERWCVMGKNGAGKSTLLKMVAGQLAPDAGDVKLGASLRMGYFAQQSLDLLDPDLTIKEAARKGLPEGVDRRAAQPRRRVPVLRRRRRQEIRALSGGEKTRLVLARMLLKPAEFPGAGRADQPPRSRDQGDAPRFAEGLRRTMLFVSHDREFSCVA